MVYDTGSHSVYYHRYHVVWATKYRYDVLRGELRLRIREIIRQVCRELNVEIIKGVLSLRMPFTLNTKAAPPMAGKRPMRAALDVSEFKRAASSSTAPSRRGG